MKKVLILMSTYNPGEQLDQQVKSILLQKGLKVNLLIRDDGSTRTNFEYIKKITQKYAEKIKLVRGKNYGWRKSFQLLVHSKYAKGYDYYGFSDQDDIWMDDKLISCINLMESDNYKGIKLAHCSALTVDSNLNPTDEQEHRLAKPFSHKMAFCTEIFQGCAMVWNDNCMQMLQRYEVGDNNITHDYWVGLIAYLFGKIYFCSDPKFYHIRYSNSQSSDGNIYKGRIRRFKKIINNEKTYMNPSYDLLNGYSQFLIPKDALFLAKMCNYKNSISNKLYLIFNRQFRRPTFSATLLMKLAILFNRY